MLTQHSDNIPAKDSKTFAYSTFRLTHYITNFTKQIKNACQKVKTFLVKSDKSHTPLIKNLTRYIRITLIHQHSLSHHSSQYLMKKLSVLDIMASCPTRHIGPLAMIMVLQHLQFSNYSNFSCPIVAHNLNIQKVICDIMSVTRSVCL